MVFITSKFGNQNDYILHQAFFYTGEYNWNHDYILWCKQMSSVKISDAYILHRANYLCFRPGLRMWNAPDLVIDEAGGSVAFIKRW